MMADTLLLPPGRIEDPWLPAISGLEAESHLTAHLRTRTESGLGARHQPSILVPGCTPLRLEPPIPLPGGFAMIAALPGSGRPDGLS